MKIVSYTFPTVTFAVRVRPYAQSEQENESSLNHKPSVQKPRLILELRRFLRTG